MGDKTEEVFQNRKIDNMMEKYVTYNVNLGSLRTKGQRKQKGKGYYRKNVSRFSKTEKEKIHKMLNTSYLKSLTPRQVIVKLKI